MKTGFLKNLMSSAGAQIVTVAFNFISIPFLLSRVGVEGYALVAFYSTLQAVFAILDSGFSPLVIKETASSVKGDERVKIQYSALLDIVRLFFLATGAFGCAVIYLSSELIVEYWLNLSKVDSHQIIQIIQMMGFIISLRWWSGFYRSLFIGHQNIVIFNGISVFIGALKFLLVILYLDFVDQSILGFFEYQLFCSVIELFLLYFIGSKINTYSHYNTSFAEKLKSIKVKYKFAIHAGISSILWLVLTQSDKFLVLRVSNLEDFAVFSLGVLGASIFFFVSSPLASAMIPKLIEINEGQGAKAFKDFYTLTFSLCTIVLVPIAIFIFKFSEELLYFWTRDNNISGGGYFVLGGYTLGNCLAVLSSFSYFLQSAKGDLKLHFFGSLIFVCLFLPLLALCVINLGINGAAVAWASSNLIMFICWGTYIHSIHMKRFFGQWLVKVFAPITLIATLIIQLEHILYLLFSAYVPLVFYSMMCCAINLVLLYMLIFGLSLKPINLMRQ